MLLKSHVLHNPSSQPELLFGYVVASLTFKAGGPTMRDIRGDLQDRAKLIAEAISSVQAQLDNQIQQLKHEHETRLEDLRSAFKNVHIVFGIEQRRVGIAKSQSTRADHSRGLHTEPQKPLSVSGRGWVTLIAKNPSYGDRLE
jgi:hypothetical protein